jgi:hypothetical protein
MRKLISLFTLFLVGCTCIGQLPPQVIYVNENCQVLLPDYTKKVRVTDNCRIDTIFQIPGVGYILDAVNQRVNVTITARDAFGNESYMMFEVIAVDTIPPIIEPDSSMLTSYKTYQNNLMKIYHRTLLADFERADQNFPDTIYYKDSVSYLTKRQILNGDSTFTQTWYEDNLMVVMPNAGEGHYMAVYYTPENKFCFCDTASGDNVARLDPIKF